MRWLGIGVVLISSVSIVPIYAEEKYSLFVFFCMIFSSILQPTTNGYISSHILDISSGRPAQGVIVLAFIENQQGWQQIGNQTTTADGRVANVSPNVLFTAATYKLRFFTGEYYKRSNIKTFYPYVEVIFSIDDASQHYHVPLTLSPFGYSTYRGS
ncbi:hypothetical protein Q1695_007309 [Nippostrongylus brasiliensis]|nr:hypothetical protein Q1695_007309 [Nippostrongylus brasiliensis]